MFGVGAISDEDKLDADEAKKVLRRAARMALPFKKTILGALCFTAMSTFGVVMGPVILGWAIDNGITPGDKTVLRKVRAGQLQGALSPAGPWPRSTRISILLHRQWQHICLIKKGTEVCIREGWFFLSNSKLMQIKICMLSLMRFPETERNRH